jgi:hypothetical protein
VCQVRGTRVLEAAALLRGGGEEAKEGSPVGATPRLTAREREPGTAVASDQHGRPAQSARAISVYDTLSSEARYARKQACWQEGLRGFSTREIARVYDEASPTAMSTTFQYTFIKGIGEDHGGRSHVGVGVSHC